MPQDHNDNIKKVTKNRRLRKKLYLGEFSVLGFKINCQLNDISSDEFDTLLDNLIDELVDRNLNLGGGGDNHSFGGFVTSNARYGNPTQDDKEYIFDWLNNHQAINEVILGEFVDANYGDF